MSEHYPERLFYAVPATERAGSSHRCRACKQPWPCRPAYDAKCAQVAELRAALDTLWSNLDSAEHVGIPAGVRQRIVQLLAATALPEERSEG